MTVQIKPHLFSVAEVEQMIETGILAEDDKVELIEGQLIAMIPIGSKHAGCVKKLNHIFSRQHHQAIVSIQDPVSLPPNSLPEPDIALLKPNNEFYTTTHPTADDVLLLIEVSDSSLSYDEETKLPLYAKAGIREVWIVSIENGWIDCYRHPSGGDYRLRERFLPGDTIQPDLVPEGAVDVSAVLGV